MLGIDDPWVWLAYILSAASAVLCAVYGLVNWNRGDDSVAKEDVVWAAHQIEAEKET